MNFPRYEPFLNLFKNTRRPAKIYRFKHFKSFDNAILMHASCNVLLKHTCHGHTVAALQLYWSVSEDSLLKYITISMLLGEQSPSHMVKCLASDWLMWGILGFDWLSETAYRTIYCSSSSAVVVDLQHSTRYCSLHNISKFIKHFLVFKQQYYESSECGLGRSESWPRAGYISCLQVC